MSCRGARWLPHVLVVVLLLAVCGCVPAVEAFGDHAQLHSFFPPILQHYWQNGFLFWSFGKQTVVTDQYVRLTEKTAGSMGYLWNRHDNQMGSFQLNVTARMLDRDGSWFSSGDASHGMGIWYAVKSSNPLADTSFYGFEKSFDGFGVVLDHRNTLTLYVGSGRPTSAASPRSVARCTVPSLAEKFITISIVYDTTHVITVEYTKHDGGNDNEELVRSSKFPTLCLTHQLDASTQDSSHHFGVTASNSASEQTVHDIHSIFMTPLSNVEAHELEEERVRHVRLFEKRGGADGRKQARPATGATADEEDRAADAVDKDVGEEADEEADEGAPAPPPTKPSRKNAPRRNKRVSKA